MELSREKAYLITTDGDITEITPGNGSDFNLEEAQRYVDGYVEVVAIDYDTIMLVDEEGKYGKKRNIAATEIACEHSSIMPCDYICGDAILCPSDMFT